MHIVQRNLKRIRSNLRQHCPGRGPNIRGIDEDIVVPLAVDAHECGRWSSTRRIRRGGYTGPGEPPSLGTHPRSWVALLPAEALRTFPQARYEAAATELMPAFGVDLGVVSH